MKVETCLTAIYNNLARHGCLPKPLRIRVSPALLHDYQDGLASMERWFDGDMPQDNRLVFKSARIEADPNLLDVQIIFEEDI